jgi:ATP-dependent DNA helicase RecQ
MELKPVLSIAVKQAEQQVHIENLKNNKKMVYVAPESLSYLENAFNQITISLIAIDEAHCISSWGHDFRPAYINLGYLKNASSTPILALTATADKATRKDISQLNLLNPKSFISSLIEKPQFRSTPSIRQGKTNN